MPMGRCCRATERTIAAGDRVQLQEPFDRIAGRNDITSGYAVVEVLAGIGVSALRLGDRQPDQRSDHGADGAVAMMNYE